MALNREDAPGSSAISVLMLPTLPDDEGASGNDEARLLLSGLLLEEVLGLAFLDPIDRRNQQASKARSKPEHAPSTNNNVCV